MHVFGAFTCYLGICGIQGRQVTISKEKIGYCSHAYIENTLKGHLGFQWHGTILQVFHQGLCFILTPITKLL
jgi:hypothetical protein